MSFEQTREQLANDIEYWSRYVSRKSDLEKEDISQELLIIVWKIYCKKKEINKYFIQQRLKWESLKMLKNFYKKNNAINTENLSEFFIIPDEREEKRMEGFFGREIFAQLAKTLQETDKLAYKIVNALIDQKDRKEICDEIGICQGYLSHLISKEIKPTLKEIYCESI